MRKVAPKNQTVTLRVTPAELELLRAASETLGWSIGEVMLSSALALGADVETRWDGALPKRLLRAYQAVKKERMLHVETLPLGSMVKHAREASAALARPHKAS